LPTLNRTHVAVYLVIALLLVAPAGVSAQAIIDAVKRNDISAVQLLLRAAPANARATDGDGATPLHWAADGGLVDIMRLLIANGARVNQQQKNGWTPAHSATGRDRTAALEVLLQNGADLNVLAQNGNAPIHFAAMYGHYATVSYLITAGVEVDTENSDGNTPLAVAAWYGQQYIGRLLIAAGADIHHQNRAGKTALDEAIRSGKADFARILTDYDSQLQERAARDVSRQLTRLNLRTGFAAWTNPKDITKTVFADNFGAPSPRREWTSAQVGDDHSALTISKTPIGGRLFLGEFSNRPILLNLVDLPDHKEIAISFDLFIIRTMDGNDSRPPNGPDIWSLGILDGPTIIQTTFWNATPDDNPRLKIQAYPGEYPGGHNEGYTGAVEKNSLGYTFPVRGQNVPLDSVYRLRFTFNHTGRAVLFRFAGQGMQTTDDESWGITNVRVAVGIAPTTPQITKPVVHPVSSAKNRPVPKVTRRVHVSTPAPIARAVARKVKPKAKAQSKTAPKRLHDKKVAPKL